MFHTKGCKYLFLKTFQGLCRYLPHLTAEGLRGIAAIHPLEWGDFQMDCAFRLHQLYGGWITANLVGPFKGDPESACW